MHECFTLGKSIRGSIHRCEPSEGFTEPLCFLSFNFDGGSSQQIMISTDELKELNLFLDSFIRKIPGDVV
jgi:hypothetical protein